MIQSLDQPRIPERITNSRTMIRRLRNRMRRYEERYECSSADMQVAVRAGFARCTTEVSKWLTDYNILKDLEAGVNHQDL